jgi:hypothetical protein
MSGTTIAIVVSPDTIVLAGDSKGTLNAGGWTQTCKLGWMNNCAFALVGLQTHTPTGFQVMPIAENACSSHGALSAKVALFYRSVRGPLLIALKDSRLNDRRTYDAWYNEKLVIQMAFAGFDGTTPHVIIEGIEEHAGSLKETVTEVPAGALQYAVIGQKAALKKLVASNPAWWAGLTPVAIGKTIVQSEIDGEPEQVGGPISVLRIDKLGVHWVERGVCLSTASMNGAHP